MYFFQYLVFNAKYWIQYSECHVSWIFLEGEGWVFNMIEIEYVFQYLVFTTKLSTQNALLL